MPHNGIRFADRSRARTVKREAVKKLDNSRPKTLVSVMESGEKLKQEPVEVQENKPITSDPKNSIKEPKADQSKDENIKKEEPTPESNDVKTDSKE